jgi:hypothetical protein
MITGKGIKGNQRTFSFDTRDKKKICRAGDLQVGGKGG